MTCVVLPRTILACNSAEWRSRNSSISTLVRPTRPASTILRPCRMSLLALGIGSPRRRHHSKRNLLVVYCTVNGRRGAERNPSIENGHCKQGVFRYERRRLRVGDTPHHRYIPCPKQRQTRCMSSCSPLLIHHWPARLVVNTLIHDYYSPLSLSFSLGVHSL